MKRTLRENVPLIGSVALILIILIALLPGSPFILLVFADTYNDDINNIEVWQYNGSAWNLLANFTTSGGSVRIHDGYQTSFIVQVKLNTSLASSASEAQSFTMSNMSILNGGTIWPISTMLNDTGTPSSSGGFWYVKKLGNWTSSLPSPGVTYSCNATFQAYY
jgi:hypothetical protein